MNQEWKAFPYVWQYVAVAAAIARMEKAHCDKMNDQRRGRSAFDTDYYGAFGEAAVYCELQLDWNPSNGVGGVPDLVGRFGTSYQVKATPVLNGHLPISVHCGHSIWILVIVDRTVNPMRYRIPGWIGRDEARESCRKHQKFIDGQFIYWIQQELLHPWNELPEVRINAEIEAELEYERLYHEEIRHTSYTPKPTIEPVRLDPIETRESA